MSFTVPSLSLFRFRMYSLWEVAGDEAQIWDVAATHINVVVAFLQMSASWFINAVWFRGWGGVET